MKKFSKFLPLLLIPVAIFFLANQSGSPGGKTGSPGDGGNTCTQCHSGTAQNSSNWITTNVGTAGYVNGQTYTITATGTKTGVSKFGFELTAEDEQGNKVGTFTITNPTETKLINGNKSVTHTSGGTTPNGNTKSWSVDYSVPAGISGDITFYASFNGANGNGGTSGDQIYLSQHTISQDVTGIEELANAMKVYPNPSTGIVNIEIPSSNKNTEATITNNSGQVVRKLNLQNQLNNLDLSDLAKGVYFVQLAGNGTNEMKKLVIN